MSNKLKMQVAQALLEIGAVGFVPDAPIRFKSGILSPIYIDNRRLPFHAGQWHIVVEGFRALIEHEGLPYDVIAGVAVGGVPHSSALAYLLNAPSVFIRKEAKEHGTKKLVEGGDVSGKRVLLVEDLVTTGGSSLNAVNALREEGGDVKDMTAIVSYGFDEARQAFAEADVQLHTLTDFSAIAQVVREKAILGEAAMSMVQDWFGDPHGWAARQGLA
ncbi:MAG: orotate phosphoribosyltransferase [Chloroflexota bacterium]